MTTQTADNGPTPSDPNPNPDNRGGGMGHSEAQWDVHSALNLTDVQLRAIELTIQGLTDVRIAEFLSIDRKTLWRWKTLDNNYRQALAEARAQLYAAATDRYQTLLMRATGVLAKFLESEEENSRFRAAKAFLNMAGCFRPRTNLPAIEDHSHDWPEPHPVDED